VTRFSLAARTGCVKIAPMRRASLLFALGLLPLIACSGGKSSSAPPTGDDGGPGGGETLTYAPQGCAYTYTPPAILGFTNLALDDTGPVDAKGGVPERVRVGLGGGTTKGKPGYADPTTSAAFTWETVESDHAAKVKLGTAPGMLTDVHTGYTWTAPKMLSGAVSNMHEVHVCGLKPGTTYFYQVGGGPAGSEVWSQVQSFTTVPASGSITVGVSGDARDTVTTWQAVHVRMKNAGVDLQLVDGDVVDSGSIDDLYDQWLDAIWHDPSDMTKFLTLGQQMILPIDGNHENDSSISFSEFAIPGDGPYAETYASFDAGSAHFVMIDDQQIGESFDVGNGSDEAKAQLAWLDADLAAANADRANHPFIVVMGHRGYFSTSNHGADSDVVAARGALVPLFDKYHVDLVLNGHDHEYERSYSLHAGNPPTGQPTVVPDGQGTVYVICAGAGADPYAVGKTKEAYSKLSVGIGPYAGGQFPGIIGTYALMKLDAHTLTLTAYGLKASGTMPMDDDVIDTLTLTH